MKLYILINLFLAINFSQRAFAYDSTIQETAKNITAICGQTLKQDLESPKTKFILSPTQSQLMASQLDLQTKTKALNSCDGSPELNPAKIVAAKVDRLDSKSLGAFSNDFKAYTAALVAGKAGQKPTCAPAYFSDPQKMLHKLAQREKLKEPLTPEAFNKGMQKDCGVALPPSILVPEIALYSVKKNPTKAKEILSALGKPYRGHSSQKVVGEQIVKRLGSCGTPVLTDFSTSPKSTLSESLKVCSPKNKIDSAKLYAQTFEAFTGVKQKIEVVDEKEKRIYRVVAENQKGPANFVQFETQVKAKADAAKGKLPPSGNHYDSSGKLISKKDPKKLVDSKSETKVEPIPSKVTLNCPGDENKICVANLGPVTPVEVISSIREVEPTLEILVGQPEKPKPPKLSESELPGAKVTGEEISDPVPGINTPLGSSNEPQLNGVPLSQANKSDFQAVGEQNSNGLGPWFGKVDTGKGYVSYQNKTQMLDQYLAQNWKQTHGESLTPQMPMGNESTIFLSTNADGDAEKLATIGLNNVGDFSDEEGGTLKIGSTYKLSSRKERSVVYIKGGVLAKHVKTPNFTFMSTDEDSNEDDEEEEEDYFIPPTAENTGITNVETGALLKSKNGSKFGGKLSAVSEVNELGGFGNAGEVILLVSSPEASTPTLESPTGSSALNSQSTSSSGSDGNQMMMPMPTPSWTKKGDRLNTGVVTGGNPGLASGYVSEKKNPQGVILLSSEYQMYDSGNVYEGKGNKLVAHSTIGVEAGKARGEIKFSAAQFNDTYVDQDNDKNVSSVENQAVLQARVGLSYNENFSGVISAKAARSKSTIASDESVSGALDLHLLKWDAGTYVAVAKFEEGEYKGSKQEIGGYLSRSFGEWKTTATLGHIDGQNSERGRTQENYVKIDLAKGSGDESGVGSSGGLSENSGTYSASLMGGAITSKTGTIPYAGGTLQKTWIGNSETDPTNISVALSGIRYLGSTTGGSDKTFIQLTATEGNARFNRGISASYGDPIDYDKRSNEIYADTGPRASVHPYVEGFYVGINGAILFCNGIQTGDCKKP